MPTTMERLILEAKQFSHRCKAALRTAELAKTDSSVRPKFFALHKQILARHEEFEQMRKDTLLDESSELLNNLFDLNTEIDDLLSDFDGIYLFIQGSEHVSNLPTAVSVIVSGADPQPHLTHSLQRQDSQHSLDRSSLYSTPQNRSSAVRLPKVDLPKFSGSLRDWPTFFDLFATLIHNNESVSPVEKFQYLLLSLSGEPLTLVKHLPLNANNYPIAFQSLVDRYQNERLLVSSYWQSITDVPRATTDSVASLRSVLNTFNENITALSQHPNIDLWDFTLFNWLLQKLDNATQKRFELQFANTDFPTFEQLKGFVTDQCRALENHAVGGRSSASLSSTTSNRQNHSRNSQSRTERSGRAQQSFIINTPRNESRTYSCPKCRANHSIHQCPSFLALTPHNRHQFAKASRLCINCLGAHALSQCKSSSRCRVCQGHHHTALHFPREPVSEQTVQSTDDSVVTPIEAPSPLSTPSDLPSTTVGLTASSPSTTVLLATVLLEVRDRWGNFQRARALCDPGSQVTLITDRCRKRLGLQCFRSVVPLAGLGHTPITDSRGSTQFEIRPVQSTKQRFKLNAIILPNICSYMPHSQLQDLNRFNQLQLADPGWHQPGPIDLLLGADIYATILRGGFIPGNECYPAAIETVFGWILMGAASGSSAPHSHSFFVSAEKSLDQTLKKFWEVEEIPSSLSAPPEEAKVERLFSETYFRDQSGRFGVALPFKEFPILPTFQHSLEIADRRLLALERRLSRQPLVQAMYRDFMQDYLDSGHMSLLSAVSGSDAYYIPHHCVFKLENNIPKIRVVFDASAKDANNLSLNDTLSVGPKLQNDIVTVILRFRLPQFVFTCDIRQMYRQILITQPHRLFQLIRWRFDRQGPIQTFQLNTVTYGMSSSPFLAIRCLLQLAEEGQQRFPRACKSIRDNLYVDDLATGADDKASCRKLQSELIDLLNGGCFELRKWSSNDPSLLETIPQEHCQTQNVEFNNEADSPVSVLGLQWQGTSDCFTFSIRESDSPPTKRSILSEVARIYDPLGFLAPVTCLAKHLIQRLWALGLGWDESLPNDIRVLWDQYKASLHVLSGLKIPRLVKPKDCLSRQLHGFCDASETGYACVIYIRTRHHDNSYTSNFVIAKSKVAPLKSLSIPRLELCAAVLLSNLLSYVLNTYSHLIFDQVVAWSDSSVVLSWIRSSPHRWKTFVANRVSHIQDRVSPEYWRHVPSTYNPADPASRGLLPEDLFSCSIWWAGPSWLTASEDTWPLDSSTHQPTPEVEVEQRKILIAEIVPSVIDDLLEKFSSLTSIQAIIAWCMRFVRNSKASDKVVGPLTRTENHQALLCIARHVQASAFSAEIRLIRQGLPCPKPLQRLSLFIHSDGLLRVGGRISRSSLPFDTKHPVLLPSKHRFVELLVKSTHERNWHTGVNTTVYLLQQNFWLLAAKRVVRNFLNKCNHCFRQKPTSLTPPMGDLPPTRVSQAKPFSCVGVDYGGPFPITMSRTRGSKRLKAYICLFVCFSTRAVHIEIASDLSKDTFIAALRRFISRRGRCSMIFSDCGTNFVAANRELCSYMQQAVTGESIEWRFIPPASPHFGGLWESGIKSVKTHLTRVVGEQVLTYEELNTLVVQIEGLLNSRPLCSLSCDPNDLSVLTPGHFLTLEPLTAPPNPDLSHLKIARLSRWQLIQRLQQDFWKRWRNEYLHQFYTRGKWAKTRSLDPLDIGTLVLLKDDLTPPLQWRLGRILEVHPGADQIIRVATVRTPQGIFKRPVVKLCPLPTQ